jgi:predicted NUDIX family NTP pyrophosphohydrolase
VDRAAFFKMPEAHEKIHAAEWELLTRLQHLRGSRKLSP